MKTNDKQIAEISKKYLLLKLGESISPIDLDSCDIHQLAVMVDGVMRDV